MSLLVLTGAVTAPAQNLSIDWLVLRWSILAGVIVSAVLAGVFYAMNRY